MISPNQTFAIFVQLWGEKSYELIVQIEDEEYKKELGEFFEFFYLNKPSIMKNARAFKTIVLNS